MAFTPALLPEAGFKVSATGEFGVVTDSKAFAPELAARTEGLIRAAAPPSGDHVRDMMEEAVETTPTDLSPGMLEAAAAANYQLDTAMWIGATLDQGVWYEIDAPLPLPGMPRVIAPSRIEFAFTRMVPCSVGAAEPTCVEIVVRSVPDNKALDRVRADYNSQSDDEQIDDYTASTKARIVTDPATLLPFAREKWDYYWYTSFGKSNTVLQSEHLVSTTSYRAASQ
jgi:hypothetical protein